MKSVKIIEITLLLMAVDARWCTGWLYWNSVGNRYCIVLQLRSSARRRMRFKTLEREVFRTDKWESRRLKTAPPPSARAQSRAFDGDYLCLCPGMRTFLILVGPGGARWVLVGPGGSRWGPVGPVECLLTPTVHNLSCESLRPHVTPFRQPGAQHDLPIFSTYTFSARIDLTPRCSSSEKLS